MKYDNYDDDYDGQVDDDDDDYDYDYYVDDVFLMTRSMVCLIITQR